MLLRVDDKQGKGNERMIEIPIFYGRLIAALTLAIPIWFTLWMLLAAFLEYPNEPSWRTAVPAACLVLFGLLCALKVIVFV